MAQPEEWREVVGFPNFEVSASGRVRNIETGAILEGTVGASGTRQYTMRARREIVTVYAQNLVWDAFVGEPLMASEHVVHSDGNKLNNHFTNLEAIKKGGRPRKW